MISKTKILKTLKSQKTKIFERFGVSELGLFGSYVRNESTEKSDIDLLISFANGQETFDNFMGACFYLEDLFSDKKVEVVTRNGLSPHIGPHILKEVEYV